MYIPSQFTASIYGLFEHIHIANMSVLATLPGFVLQLASFNFSSVFNILSSFLCVRNFSKDCAKSADISDSLAPTISSSAS